MEACLPDHADEHQDRTFTEGQIFHREKLDTYNILKLRTPETLMRQGFITFSDIRHHYIMHTVLGTSPIDPAVLP